jgi:hypothetical protein
MPVLTNPRHEKFAQLLAQLHGESKTTVTDAHEQAGYKRNDGNASTLAQHPDVQAFRRCFFATGLNQGRVSCLLHIQKTVVYRISFRHSC